MTREPPRRRARHWKQRFDPGARFIFRQRGNWYGTTYEIGDPIPEQLQNDYRRLRRAWDQRRIELEVFEPISVPDGRPMSEVYGDVQQVSVEQAVEVIQGLDPEDVSLFTVKDGIPKVEAIENVLRFRHGGKFKLSAGVRDVAWQKVKEDS